MTMKNDAIFEKELTCQFETDMRNLINFDPSTRKSQTFALEWAAFDRCIECLSLDSTDGLCLMTFKIYTEFVGKLTFAAKNDMRSLASFNQSVKSENWDFDDIILSKVENV